MGQSNLTAEQLEAILMRLSMVQLDFAEKLGVTQATVSRWLNGQTAVPAYVEAWLKEAHPWVLTNDGVVDAVFSPQDEATHDDE